MKEIIVNRGKVDKGTNFINLENQVLEDVEIIGDKLINDGEGYNGVCVVKDSDIINCNISNFGGYGIVTSNGKNNISIYDVKDEDGKTVYGISYKNLEMIDDSHIHLIKRINVENFNQFELGYTFGYMGYNYCNGRNYLAKFYDVNDEVIEVVKGVQYDKIEVPNGAKLVDFIIEQTYIPTRGNSDFNDAVLFISDYDCPKVEIKDCYIHDQSRENIAICGGQGVNVDNCRLENTWIGLCIEDGWELCKDVLVKNCKFNGNGRDVIIASGRNLVLENNTFSAWVNIGNRVEGLKFNNNIFDVSDANHKRCNDRFVIEVHKGDIEICDNVFKKSRVQLFSDDYAKAGNAKVIMKGNVFEDTPITVMDKLFICEDSEIKGKPERIAGQYKNCNLHFIAADVCGVDVTDSDVHDINRCKFQNTNTFDNCNISNVGFEIFNDYKNATTTISNSNLNDTVFAINGRGKNNVKYLVNNCTIRLTKPLIDMYNITGMGTYHFKDCKIIGDNIDYLCKTVWADSDPNECKIIFENCTIEGVKEIANPRIKKYITVL